MNSLQAFSLSGAALLCVVAAAVSVPHERFPAAGAFADSAEAAVANRFAQAAKGAAAQLARDGGALWGVRLDTGAVWAGVRGQKMFLTADPRMPDYERAGPALWAGPLPPGVAPANTSLRWAGRRWAMVILPVPDDPTRASRLLVHEAMHAAQPAVLPSPSYAEGGAGADLLDGPEGRTWLLLEMRALTRAVASSGAARRRAAEDALTFRARRYAAALPQERERERALDVSEGLPEYTAWRLTRGTAAELAASIRAGSGSDRSWVRSFPYQTGPAYGVLLDALAGDGWRRQARDTARRESLDLQRLLAASLGAPAAGRLDAWLCAAGDSAALARSAERAGRDYGLEEVRAAEDARWADRERTIAELRARFVDDPTLRLRPGGGVSVSFDPGRQTPLGAAGTVMGGLIWKGEDGAELLAPNGALVAAAWNELRIPLPDSAAGPPLAEGPLPDRRSWKGAGGWSLTLPAGWRLTRDSAGWVARPR
ncbi:MAG TPA: hypothetical protein VKA84_21810 [Gemmatimonadaceae bacterium]|nr:hypothetical protein [Gemmatimonadaceae bacterium]